MEFEDNEFPDLRDTDVVTKYKTGADMINRVLRQVVDACKAGASALQLCQMGDELIEKEVAPVFNKKVEGKPIPKGIAFPTCVSVNNVLAHNSPVSEDEDSVIADGDVVKIDMGLHLGGYISVAAHTLVVGASKESPAKGAAADVVLAAYNAAQAACRLIKPGNSTADVIPVVNKIAEAYGVSAVEDMSAHSMSCFELTGEKSVVFKPSEARRSEAKSVQFEENEVYSVDVFMTTGDGKAKPSGKRTNVYQATGEHYTLRGKHSRAFFGEVQNCNKMAFSLRRFENLVQARMGVKECVDHRIVQPFDVIQDKPGSVSAQFRFVILLMANGNLKVTGIDLDADTFASEHSIEDEAIAKILAQPMSSKSKKKKKKSKSKAGDGAAAAAAAAGDA
jgi:curved DNA binding protein